MIPLIQAEIESHGWMTAAEFADIIAIAEMTPGPIAVNSATFVGYKTAGIIGGIVATAGVALPSLVLILLISRFFFTYRDHPANVMLFYGIRPVVTGLIITAALFVAQTAIFNMEFSFEFLKGLLVNPFEIINFKGVVIMLIAFFAIIRYKLHPVAVIASSGFLGFIFFYLVQ